MTRTLDANQLKKIDRPYLQPIYFLHLYTHWEYRGNQGLDSSAGHAGTNKVISNYNGLDDWLSAGIKPGDLFNLDLIPGNWGVVASVDTDDQITLVANYPPMEGSGYTFKRDETLYFSDRNFTYNGHNYEDYISNLSDIESQCRNLGGYDNPKITLQFKNDKIRTYNYLIEFFDNYCVEQRYVEIYKLLIDTGEVFISDVSTLIFKGEMGSPYEITEIGFSLDAFSMLFGKNAKLPLDVIDLYDWPGADPDDVGKYRNIIYGSLKKVICPWTDAGWLSTLTAEITAEETTVVVSDATNAPTTPFTTLCDSEQIRVTGKVTNTFTMTRHYGGTTAVPHNMGATIYEKKTDFEAEVAMHPVKSIGDIYVKSGSSEWLRLVSGATKYLSTGGRAYIRFSDKPKFEQKINITASTVPDEGTHIHAIPAGGFSSKECIPDGSAGPTGHANVIDGNTASYCGIAQDVSVTAKFDGEVDLGTINKQIIWVYKNDTGGAVKIYCPAATLIAEAGAGASGLLRAVKTGGVWTNEVVCIGAEYGNQIGEIYKTVEYTPAASEATTHAASGIDVAVTLSGNSAANMVIGDQVACDVTGYADSTRVIGTDAKYYSCILTHTAAAANKPITGGDYATYWTELGADGLVWATGEIYQASGTYTGTVDLLIERPDHIRKHILIALLGFTSTDIGTSFATVGTTYAGRIANGYKFAFVLHDVAVETMDLFEKMDQQSRSNMFESGGKFVLVFGSTADPASQMTFDKDNIEGSFVFSKTDAVDIRNKIRAHYLRDYTKSGDLGEKYQKVREVTDTASISRYGEMAEDREFNCIGDLVTMINDVLAWVLNEEAEIKKLVDFFAFWDAMILENCDYFTVISNFWTGHKFRTLKLKPSEEKIEIRGIEYVA